MCLCVCGDTQTNAVCHTGDFRAQAIKEIEIVAGGVNMEARYLESDCRLLEGRGESNTSRQYQTCMCKFKALLSLAEINVRVMHNQENMFVMCDACMVCLCAAVQFVVC